MLLAVDFYDVTLFFHILAVVLAAGPPLAYAVFFSTAGKAGPQALAAVGRAIVTWGRTVATASLVVILISGLYLTDERWDFNEFFISWGFAAILILFGLAHGYFIPKTGQLVEAIEAGRAEQAQSLAAGLRKMGPVSGAVWVLTIYVMTAKPFL